MPQINVHGKIITCEVGANLRQVLLSHQVPVHNGNAAVINCRGLGTCGTCAVEIEGDVSPQQWREKARLSLPPHQPETSRRLSQDIIEWGKELEYTGVKAIDALHAASAETGGCDFFLTCDDRLLRRYDGTVKGLNPASFILTITGKEQ